MSRGACARQMMRRFATPWYIVIGAAVVIGSIAAVAASDLRWLLFVFFIILVAAPVILSNTYYSYGMRRECYFNSSPHTAVVTETGIVIRIFGTTEEVPVLLREEVFVTDMLGRVEVMTDGMIVEIVKPHKGFIWIPEDAYNTPEEYTKALRAVNMNRI